MNTKARLKSILKYVCICGAVVIFGMGTEKQPGATVCAKAVETADVLQRENNTGSETEYVYDGFVYTVQWDDTVSIIRYEGKEEIVNVPRVIDGKTVTSIGGICFSYNNIVKEITFPDTIRYYGSIGYSCANLEKVTFNAYKPENSSDATFSYGNGLFSYCPKLKTIIVNENEVLKTFYAKDNVLYSYGQDVDSLVLYPGGKTDAVYTFEESLQIGQSAFEGNKYIEKVIFSKPLKDNYTYNEASGTWDKVIDTNCVFRYCTSLKEVQFTGLTEIGSWFDGCTALEEYTIPDTVTKIRSMMFNGCTSLRELTIPASVKMIENTLCQDCVALEKCIVYSDTVEYEKDAEGIPFDGVWNGCDKLIIYCNEGSTTEAYAKMYGLNYKYMKDIEKDDTEKDDIENGDTENKDVEDEGVEDTDADVEKKDAQVPTIKGNIKGGTYSYNEKVALKISAKVEDKGKISYQWYKNSKNKKTGATKIKGATKSSYNVSTKNIGTTYYFCKITNTNKNVNGKTTATVYSKIAKIKVEKAKNPIEKISKYSKAVGSNIQLTVKGNATYKSSNTSVASVSKKGKVSLKKIGTATITVKAAGNKYYKSANKKITITVTPKKATIVSVKASGKNKMVVKWKKDSKVTGYQIQYADNTKFKDAKTVKISKNKNTTTTIKKLKKNTKYYVRVREYKKVANKNIYGAWSKVKIKK